MSSRETTKSRKQRGKVAWNPKDNVSDAIYGAIRAHCDAFHDAEKCVTEREYLDRAYPGPEKEQTPLQRAKYREVRKREGAAWDVETRTAWALVTVIPSTWDGIDALLSHAAEYVFDERMTFPNLTDGAPASLKRLHREWSKLSGLSESCWWVALALSVRTAINQLRVTNPDASLPPGLAALEERIRAA